MSGKVSRSPAGSTRPQRAARCQQDQHQPHLQARLAGDRRSAGGRRRGARRDAAARERSVATAAPAGRSRRRAARTESVAAPSRPVALDHVVDVDVVSGWSRSPGPSSSVTVRSAMRVCADQPDRRGSAGRGHARPRRATAPRSHYAGRLSSTRAVASWRAAIRMRTSSSSARSSSASSTYAHRAAESGRRAPPGRLPTTARRPPGDPSLRSACHAFSKFRDARVARAYRLGRHRTGAGNQGYTDASVIAYPVPADAPKPTVVTKAARRVSRVARDRTRKRLRRMCLAIPGQIVEIVDDERRLAKVDVAGVRRNVNIGLLDVDGGVGPGDWVLIHVGFAISQVDEEEARATRSLLERMGEDYERELEELQGERDRMSDPPPEAACGSDHCITCGDDGVPMTVLRLDAGAGLAECADDDGGAERRRDRAGRRRVATGDRCSCTRASRSPASTGGGRRMKFVDEFRDAALGRAVAGEILVAGRAGPPLQGDGGLRRPHPLDLQVRRRRPAAVERRARARPRLPGLRDPDGPRRRRHRPRPHRGRDLHLLRRHDAGAGRARHAARGQGRRRGRADGLLAARRAADREGEPRPRGRLLRDRVRDDRAVDRADAEARAGRGRRRTSPACATT